VNRNQILTTKSIAAFSSSLEDAPTGEAMALIPLAIDLQSHSGESLSQLTKAERAQTGLCVNQPNIVFSFLRNVAISRSARSSANHRMYHMKICSCFLLQYNYMLSIKYRRFSSA